MNVLRAVIYVRLSRTTESSTSLARQEASCRGYAERQGWTVLRVFQDSNVSGGEPPGERPALRELCENLSHYDVLLTWRADRIARSLIHFSSVIEACDTAGVRLVAIEDGWDMSTPHGRFAANVLASFAQFERELGRERTVSSQNHLRKTGRWAADGCRMAFGRRRTRKAGARSSYVMTERSHEYRLASTRLETCERQPHKPGGWEMRAAAQSMWDAWNVWCPEERGSYLVGCQVRAVVSSPPRPRARVEAADRCVCDLGNLIVFDGARSE